MTDRLLTAEELAERLGVPAKWPLAQARAGAIPCVRLGRYVRFNTDDIDLWLTTCKQGGRPTAFRTNHPTRGA